MGGRTQGHWMRWGVVLALAGTAGMGSGAAAVGPKTAIFNVTAVHEATDGKVTITSKVWITPTRARAEVNHPLQGKQIILVNNGYWYQLDTGSKKGIKAPLPPEMKKSSDVFSDLVAKFAFDASGPLKMSKKVRTENVSGYNCDVFTNQMTEGGDSRSITVWVPQSMDPSFPLKALIEDKSRLEKPGATINQTYTVTITLSSVQLRTPIPTSLFVVPKGYTLKAIAAPTSGAGPGAPKRHK